jgi:hypothetical protein
MNAILKSFRAVDAVEPWAKGIFSIGMLLQPS